MAGGQENRDARPELGVVIDLGAPLPATVTSDGTGASSDVKLTIEALTLRLHFGCPERTI